MTKLIEVNSETNICECCGKSNLKRVAVIELNDGSIVRYGTTCAGKKLGKKFGKSIDLLVEVAAYIAKYPTYSADTMTRGIWNKFGLTAQYKGGHWDIYGLGRI